MYIYIYQLYIYMCVYIEGEIVHYISIWNLTILIKFHYIRLMSLSTINISEHSLLYKIFYF